jgi:hypothetical protein
MDPDISIWRKTGHFYFALTRTSVFMACWFYGSASSHRYLSKTNASMRHDFCHTAAI